MFQAPVECYAEYTGGVAVTPKVGDKVWFGTSTFRGKRSFSFRVVTSVGRKYFYVGRSKFEINDKISSRSVGDDYPSVVYESKETHDMERRRDAAVLALLNLIGDRWQAQAQLRDVPTGNILRATELLRGAAL